MREITVSAKRVTQGPSVDSVSTIIHVHQIYRIQNVHNFATSTDTCFQKATKYDRYLYMFFYLYTFINMNVFVLLSQLCVRRNVRMEGDALEPIGARVCMDSLALSVKEVRIAALHQQTSSTTYKAIQDVLVPSPHTDAERTTNVLSIVVVRIGELSGVVMSSPVSL